MSMVREPTSIHYVPLSLLIFYDILLLLEKYFYENGQRVERST